MDIDLEALFRMFAAECGEHLDAMEEGLLAIESEPENKDGLREVFRSAHTIKGNAMTVSATATAELAHGVEDALEELLREGATVTRELVSLLLMSVDTLRSTVRDAVEGRQGVPGEHDGLLTDLARELGRASGPTVSKEHTDTMESELRDDESYAERRSRTLRVDVERLDQLLDLTGEIAIARGRLGLALEQETSRLADVLETYHEADRLYLDLQEVVMTLRLVRVGPLFRQYARTVRDLGLAQGKKANLVIEGGEVEVDTRVIDHLRDPLTHMIRNALDHGIETPEVRSARGKDPTGVIAVRARHEAGNIVIDVTDDGAGVDRGRVIARAQERGTVFETTPSDEDLYRLVFESGFSTADSVTEISGRGVGMDVVRRNVEMLRGTVSLHSHEAVGTTVTLRLPMTLAIIDGFVVSAGGERFVVPLGLVTECLELPREEHGGTRRTGTVSIRGEVVPYVRLGDLFDSADARANRQQLVVVHHLGRRSGIVVDELLGERQVVVKPLGKILGKSTGLSGFTVLADGRVALILDVSRVLEEVESFEEALLSKGPEARTF